VLRAAAEASGAAGDLQRKRKAELEAVRSAEEEALFSGKPTDPPPVTVTEGEIAQAGARAQAARDALQRFVRGAIETIQEREPDIVSALEETRREAAAKRAEARALHAEADQLEVTPKRLTLWLARINGESKLGHFPYAEMAPPPPPEPLDMKAALAGGSSTEVEVNA
jgi:hypothetical protein